MKKLKLMITLIILFFSFFLLIYIKEKSYKVNYESGIYKVEESYNKKDKVYYIKIKDKKDTYNFILNKKYSRDRKLIKNIKKEVIDFNEKCLYFKFKNEYVIPSCIVNNEKVSYHLTSNEMKSKINKKIKIKKNKTSKTKTFKNINILKNNLKNEKIYIWNYHGFNIISKNHNNTIKLYDKDVYNPTLIGVINNFILIPNYNESYEYSSFKIINTKDNKITKLKLNDNISEDSYILGVNDKSIFIYDPKFEKEYEIVPHKLKYREVNPLIYNKGKKEEVNSVELKNKTKKFIYNDVYNYKVINNNIYRTNKYNKDKVKITNLNVKEIVKKDFDKVYFISDDKLYVYYDNKGTIELINYFEFNFNYQNLIYIFN